MTDQLQRELDFYRSQCNQLGGTILRLQEDYARARQDATRSRTVAGLVRQAYRLANSDMPNDQMAQEFLQVVLGTLNADRAALLEYLPQTDRFVVHHSLGFAPDESPTFVPWGVPEEFTFVNAKTQRAAGQDRLLQAVGTPYLLWAFDPRSAAALLVGSTVEDQYLHRPFGEEDQELAESVLAVFVDSRERRKAEEALRASEEKYRTLVENVSVGIYRNTGGPDGAFLQANPALARIHGYDSVQEFMAVPVSALYQTPEDRRAFVENLYAKESVTNEEIRLRRKDGALIWASCTARVHRGAHGEAEWIDGVLEDITERKRAEEELLFKNTLLQAQSDTSIDAILVVNSDGKVVSANDRMREMWGVPEEIWNTQDDDELLQHAVSMLKDPDEFIVKVRHLYEHIHERSRDEIELRDGRVLDRYSAPLIDTNGQSHGRIWYFRDISERKQAEVAMMKAKEEAEAAAAAKSQFLANMSHEIRTPINGVMGMLRLLGRDELAARHKRYIDLASRSADILLAVVGDVLDFSKIEAGHLELDHRDFGLREAVDSAVRLFAEQAEAQGLELSYAVSPELPDKMVGDPNRLRQVLINLVANATKFTEAGDVHVDARLVERSAVDVVVGFSVRDTGPGIPLEQRETIFESFSQGDASTRRRHGGTGLGLAISRRLVALMGGEIGVESELGKGSTFSFAARLGLQRDAPAAVAERVVEPSGQRVLVVDDADTAREVVCEYVSTWGCEVGRAASASDALRELREAVAADMPYAMVLIDAHMPGIDGFRLAELLRQEAPFQSLPLVLLSGQAVPLDGRLRECGFAAVVPKPIGASDLYDAIVVAAGGSSPVLASRDVGAQTEACTAAPGCRILLVEDNAINQEVAREMIESVGYACECLSTGAQALDAVATGRFDLVLTDCQMPGVDGYEATARIRAWEKQSCPGAHIPIIALTAHAMKGDRDRCQEAGMDDYLSKPLLAEELRATLAKWLRADGPHPPPGPEGRQGEADRALSRPDGDADAEAAVVARCSGNRSLAARLLRDFVSQSSQDMDTMSRAVAEGDVEALAQAAHRLSGAAANLALRGSEAVGAELESLAREGKTDGAGRLVVALRVQIDRVAGMTILQGAP